MNVSPLSPFKLIYSLFQHEYLGYLIESFVIANDESGRLTLRYQNISSKNAYEFDAQMDEQDYELIALMDSMQQDAVIKKFSAKKIAPEQFFINIYGEEKGNKAVQEQIELYLESRRAQILEMIAQGNKPLYTMARDGSPADQRVEIQKERASIHFHFRRNEEGTHYFPTIKHAGQKLEFQYKDGRVICNQPAWLLVAGKLYRFQQDPDGRKIRPFLNKKFIAIAKKMEPAYYERFIAPLIQSFDVVAVGFEIREIFDKPLALIHLSEMSNAPVPALFSGDDGPEDDHIADGLLITLTFQYEGMQLHSDKTNKVSVRLEQEGDEYIFHKVQRDTGFEETLKQELLALGLPLRHGKAAMNKASGISWINAHIAFLNSRGVRIKQATNAQGKRYFLGEATIQISIEELNDWFDVKALVKFGDYEIPFLQLRKLILSNKREFVLPNGEIAVIPEAWLVQYSDLLHFIDEYEDGHILQKHHLSLISELEISNRAQVTLNRKLEKLREFSHIEEYDMPQGFLGTLRPYQKAGYNWLRFLDDYAFGGCLADDMGLGKTVQTLAMLQAQKGNPDRPRTSLLIMPTSLLYNWEREASRFTPDLKVFNYTGTQRIKDPKLFEQFDLVLTSYGIVRLDIELLERFYFHYVILDESQVIKNPSSNIAKSVMRLKSKRRLILTGTPLENNTMDLWTQMTFANPGILGSQQYFKREFQLPIEKKQDVDRAHRLNAIIKPFIMRRHKSQVAQDLPPKVEQLAFCEMTEAQADLYERTKSFFRNKILEHIEGNGVAKSQIMLLQGLTMLRQIANHPRMVEEDYKGDSGKLEDVLYKLESGLIENHKILIFSQFVKHLSILRKELDARGITYSYLDGSVKDREEEVERFQGNEDTRLFLISLRAGGLGLNLTAADYVFILDPWWNPAIEAQAIDRAHRIGQQNTVFTYKFITRGTVEEKILALQQNKLKLANDLITTEESFIKSLSKDDIDSLLA